LELETWPDLDAARADFTEAWSAEAVEVEVPVNFVQLPDGRWRRRYSTTMAVAAWSEMARRPVLPPRGTRTLLVPATKADFVSPELIAALRDRLGDDLTVREVDCGHAVYLLRPAEVGALLREFLCEA
jgi:lipase